MYLICVTHGYSPILGGLKASGITILVFIKHYVDAFSDNEVTTR